MGTESVTGASAASGVLPQRWGRPGSDLGHRVSAPVPAVRAKPHGPGPQRSDRRHTWVPVRRGAGLLRLGGAFPEPRREPTKAARELSPAWPWRRAQPSPERRCSGKPGRFVASWCAAPVAQGADTSSGGQGKEASSSLIRGKGNHVQTCAPDPNAKPVNMSPGWDAQRLSYAPFSRPARCAAVRGSWEKFVLRLGVGRLQPKGFASSDESRSGQYAQGRVGSLAPAAQCWRTASISRAAGLGW